jgi:hypothetical protein
VSQRARIATVAAAVVVLAGAFLLLRPESEDSRPADVRAPTQTEVQAAPEATETAPTATAEEEPEPEPEPEFVEIDVAGGELDGGVRDVEVRSGERVRIAISSDVAEEIHVHGYDIYEDIPAGGTGRVSFDADLEGIFEVELHGSGAQVASLVVSP